MRSLRCAFAFLTRLPVGNAAFDGRDVGRALGWFPVVGLVVGLIQWMVLLATAALPPWVSATLAAVVMALVTGAFHLDALADMADGFGGGHTRADVLRIMRDHVIGAYGGVALILGLSLRIAVVASLIACGRAGVWVCVAAAVAKWSSALLGWRLPYARRETTGVGSAVTDHMGWPELLQATTAAVLIAMLALGWKGALPLVVTLVVAVGMGRWCMRRIGGVTGDTLGATTELCELAILTVGLLVERSV
ncbi:MAG: adenosylcobinamide-GDP ribazoletransferase [Myxococcota bacterium]